MVAEAFPVLPQSFEGSAEAPLDAMQSRYEYRQRLLTPPLLFITSNQKLHIFDDDSLAIG
jgi:hypothetical protein